MKFHAVLLLTCCLTFGTLLTAQNLICDSSFSFNCPLKKWQLMKGFPAVYTALDLKTEYQWTRKKMAEIDTSHMDAVMWMPIQGEFTSQSRYKTNSVFFCELAEPMQKDSTYIIQMMILPGEFIGVKSVQVYFSPDVIKMTDKVAALGGSQVVLADSSWIINELIYSRKRKKDEQPTSRGIWTGGYLISKWIVQFRSQWLRISGTYFAKGGEQFIYVGNVRDFEYRAFRGRIRHGKLVKCRNNDPSKCPHAGMEFFVDDVLVRKQ